MKYNYISLSLLLGAATMFVGCAGEEADIFDSSTILRLEQAAKENTAKLASSPNGWIMEYFPTSQNVVPQGKGYLMLADFDTNGSVRIAMNNSASGDKYLEDTSLWQVITDNGVVLTFNSYNKCLHTFSTPDDISSTDGSEWGLGYEGDYEFIMVDVPEDEQPQSMMLKGKKRGTYTRLTRINSDIDFQTYFNDVNAFTSEKFNKTAPNEIMINVEGQKFAAQNSSTGILTAYPYGGDPLYDNELHSFLVSKHGDKYCLFFRDGIKLSDGTTTNDFVYDEQKDAFVSVDNANVTVEGYNPSDFFFAQMDNGREWMFNAKTDKSEAMNTIVDNMVQEMKTLKSWTFRTLTFTKNKEGKYELVLDYQPKGSSARKVSVEYTFTPSAEGAKLTFDAASASVAVNNLFETIPTFKTLVNAFVGDMLIEPSTSWFNLSKINIKSKSNADLWTTLQLK